MEHLIDNKVHVDNLFIFSDMMISPGTDAMSHTTSGEKWTVGSVLKKYRDTVNSNMLFVTVDLAGHGRNTLGADLEDDDKNILVTGYSDAILRLVTEIQTSQVDAVKEQAQKLASK
jgi:hypothetical protein